MTGYSVSVSAAVYARLMALAKQRGVSVHALIVEALGREEVTP